MARRRRRGGRHRRRQEPLSTWLMVGAIALIVSVLGYIYLTDEPDPVMDPETLCPESMSRIPHLEVLLFERNRRVHWETKEFTPISPNLVLEIRRQLERQLLSMPKYAMVEVYEVNYRQSELFSPIARFCNPGDGSDLSELTGNPRLAEQRYREKFREPFRKIVESMTEWSPEYSYGLVETLGILSRLALGNPELHHASKSLTVVSDFIVPQNFIINGRVPKSFSGIPRSAPLADFGDYFSSGGSRADFAGASVRMLVQGIEYVNIPDIQGAEHIAWWERYFDAQNAFVEEVVRVGDW